MTKDNQYVFETLSLMNSMILSGEQHSEESEKRFRMSLELLTKKQNFQDHKSKTKAELQKEKDD